MRSILKIWKTCWPFLMRLVGTAILSSFASLANATTDQPMTFETFVPCTGNSQACAMRLLAKGKIQIDSAVRLQAFLKAKAAQDPYFNKTAPITFDSPGGSLVGGMELGRLIRKLKIDTELTRNYSEEVLDNSPDGFHTRTVVKNAVCASACSLAFLGGVKRIVADDAMLGLHQFSTANGTLGEGGTQITVAAIAGYVQEMGVDRRMVDIASVTPNQNMRWLTSSEARELRIDNTTPPLNAWRVIVDKDGAPSMQVHHLVAPGHMVQLTLAETRGHYVVVILVGFSKRYFALNRLKQFPVGVQPEIYFTINNRFRVVPNALGPWVIQPWQGEMEMFNANFELTKADMVALRDAKSLRMDDNFGNALSDLTLSSNLSVESLSGGVKLLLRADR